MTLFPTLPELLSALSLGAWLLLALALGLLLYGYIADRVVFESGGRLHVERFGPVDVGAVSALSVLLAMPVVSAIWSPRAATDAALPSASQMIAGIAANSVVEAVIVGGVLGGLAARHIAWREVFGLDRQSPLAVLGLAALLLMAAFPLIQGVTLLWQLLLAANHRMDDSPQELVRFLAHSDSWAARMAVAVSAVFIAPLVEETIFRGYLYGVVRRYAGVTVGILFNATLFAAIHLHLPSFGGLFVLAVCLSLAYEWTGSIFVNMTMHALFNAFSVEELLSGHTSGAFIHGH